MTAKEYLKRYNVLAVEIEQLKAEQVKLNTKNRAKKIAVKAGEQDKIIAVIHKLNNSDWERVLYLRYMSDKDYEEIAEAMGYSVSHVMRLRREALNKIEQIME